MVRRLRDEFLDIDARAVRKITDATGPPSQEDPTDAKEAQGRPEEVVAQLGACRVA